MLLLSSPGTQGFWQPQILFSNPEEPVGTRLCQPLAPQNAGKAVTHIAVTHIATFRYVESLCIHDVEARFKHFAHDEWKLDMKALRTGETVIGHTGLLPGQDLYAL